MIIAVAISAVVTVTIFEIFGGVILNWKKAENRMAEDFKANNLYILLSKKFDEFYWYKAIKDFDKYFDGKENSILFISYYSVKIPYFPVTTEIFLDGENNLVMEETPFFFNRPDAEIPEPKRTVLWKKVKTVKFSYLVSNGAGKKGSNWVGEYVKSVRDYRKLIGIKCEVILNSGRKITAFSFVKTKKENGGGGGLL